MSPPDTDLDRQKARHKTPIAGMKALVIIAALVFLALVGWMANQGQEPRKVNDPALTGEYGAEPVEPVTVPAAPAE